MRAPPQSFSLASNYARLQAREVWLCGALIASTLALGSPALSLAQSVDLTIVSDGDNLPAVAATPSSDKAPERFDQRLLDLQLGDAVAEAIRSHPTVQAAQSAARASGYDVKAAKWQQFPSFSVEALAISQSSNRLQAQVVVDEPVWAGGRIRNGINRAEYARESAFSGFDESVLSISLAVVQAFFDFHRLKARNAILADSLDKHRAMVRSMERRVAQDVSPLSDLELAKSRASQIELQLVQAKGARAEALQRLRELVGDETFEPGDPVLPVFSWPEIGSDNLVADALKFDPQLKRLRFAARAADAEARAVRASILPQLSMQYSYSDAFGHRVGLVLKAQSEGGLSRMASADAARLKTAASDSQADAAERELRNQIVRDFEDYDANRLRVDSGGQAAASATRVMASYMRQFVSGRRTWLDVMNAVREATTADIDVSDARFAAKAAYIRLGLRSGQWRPETKGMAR